MTARRKLSRLFKRPNTLFLCAAYVFTAAVVAASIVMLNVKQEGRWYEILSYVVYAVASVSLIYTVCTLVGFCKRGIRRLSEKNRFIGRLVSDYGFRTMVFSACSLALTALYVVFNIAVGITSQSIWNGALAGYYIMLLLSRGGLLNYHRKERALYEAAEERRVREIRLYRSSGALLIGLTVILSVAVAQMVLSDKSFEYAGVIIYASCAYSFYKIIMSLVNLSRAKKQDDMTVRAMRNINLADALVSVLAMQTAMLRAFGEGNGHGFINGLTGTVVCLLVIILGIYMIVKGNLLLRKGGNADER